MTLFRFQRGGLEMSMATVVEVVTKEDLCRVLSDACAPLTVEPDIVTVIPYGTIDRPGVPFFDKRTGWTTYAVLIDGMCVGFANGPIPPRAEDASIEVFDECGKLLGGANRKCSLAKMRDMFGDKLLHLRYQRPPRDEWELDLRLRDEQVKDV